MNHDIFAEDDHETWLGQLVGKTVVALHIYAANSLKTINPPLSDLAEDVITAVDAGPKEARRLNIILERHAVVVDLARTGTVVFLPDAEPWVPSGRSRPPTGRLIFADGTGVDFREPAKTKRITFVVQRRNL